MQIRKTKEFLEHLLSIFSWRCLVLSLCAVVATLVSMRMGWRADYPMALIGTAVIFPIVFSINSAYLRREQALELYAQIKANLRSLYFALSHWHGQATDADCDALKKVISEPLYSIRILLTNDVHDMRDHEQAVYLSFNHLSEIIEIKARKRGFSGAEIGHTHKFLNSVMIEFETLKHIFQYRTPRALQAFSDVFITVLPILYGPVFASLATDIANPVLAFLVPALFAFVLSSLDNIQADLEDPFDGIGVDDMVINAEIFEGTLSCNFPNDQAGGRVSEIGQLPQTT